MKKSQTTIEITIGFFVVLSLFFSIISMWVWGNRQVVNRQPPFDNSRISAGQPNREPGASGGSKSLVWPVYTPEELTKEEAHF